MQKYTYTIDVVEYSYDELPKNYLPLIEEAKKQTEKAYVPYSKFHVGAAVLLANGTIIGGNNQENAAYPSGLCAERTVVFYANSQFPDEPIRAIAVAAYTDGDFLREPITPCGGCRQVLIETEKRFNSDMEVLMYGKEKIIVLKSAKDLLPFRFEGDSLIINK